MEEWEETIWKIGWNYQRVVAVKNNYFARLIVVVVTLSATSHQSFEGQGRLSRDLWEM